QTLAPLLDGKTPEQAAQLRILDPACGSGSFLIGAYQFLLDWYLHAYTADSPEEHERNGILRRVTTRNGAEWRLTIKARKDILTNNLYGVDIDSRAVETTKLSLLLRALEGETDETINLQLLSWRERALPDLGRNIQCGNALISSDFERFAAQHGLQLSEADYARLNYFDWQSAFPKVFAEGGFDAVIGNPPYSAELTDYERDYLKKRYPIGTTNTAALMMVQAHRLLKAQGAIGMIVPKSFTYASTWQKTRAFFEPELVQLVDVGRAWREVSLEQSIFIARKGTSSDTYLSSVRQGKAVIGAERIDKADCRTFGFFLNGVSSAELRIAKKVASAGVMLGDLVTNTRGGMLQSRVSQSGGNFQVIGGKNISRWTLDGCKGYLQLSEAEIERLPQNVFVQRRSLLVQNIVTYVRTPVESVRIVGAIPEDEQLGHIVILDTVNQLVNGSLLASEYLLALLHAKLINWYVYRFIFARASITMHFDGVVTDRIPVRALDLSKPDERAMHDQIAAAVRTLLSLHKQLATAASPAARQPLQRRVHALERQLDEWIYQLYGLSAEEIALVEGEA
ncbi:MAG: BREX-1 system adenine-specific DNA-methyltransferase PglX, partial [Anaerolineae bacterium]|nr:BREX-1 system adenine-specific DNA-methyltransferase PglX [Anaerolineae bacterium]